MADKEPSSGKDSDMNNGVSWQRLLSIIVNVMFPFVTMAVGWIGGQVVANTADISAINANRYTAQNAIADQRQYHNDITEIRSLLHSIDKRVPDKIPPEWFESKVEQLQAELDAIHRDIAEIKSDLRRREAP